MTNWYQVLQVSEQATDDELKAAYRRLAKKYHPDAHPGDTECEARFKEISEAYSILSDPEKRKKYDEELHHTSGAQAQKRTDGQKTKPRADNIDFQNIHRNFESFFGFNPNTKDIVDEDKLKPKSGNPLDTTDLFEKFMGIKR